MRIIIQFPARYLLIWMTSLMLGIAHATMAFSQVTVASVEGSTISFPVEVSGRYYDLSANVYSAVNNGEEEIFISLIPESIVELSTIPQNAASYKTENQLLFLPSIAVGGTVFTALRFEIEDLNTLSFKLSGYSGEPDVIFQGGKIVTVEDAHPEAQAIAISDNYLIATGSVEDVTSLAGVDTVIVDLEGRTLQPGFVDAHTHSLANFEDLPATQAHILSGGVTAIGETAMKSDRMGLLLENAQHSPVQVRISTYMTYNTKCDGLESPLYWYESEYPVYSNPDAMIRYMGVKIFGDPAAPGNPCGWAESSFPLPESVTEANSSEFGDTLLTTEEFLEVFRRAELHGYQIVIHARGDVVVDKALAAFEMLNDGKFSTARHRIDHVDVLRPDQLAQFGEFGILPLVRGRPITCFINSYGDVHPYGDAMHPYYRIAQSLVDASPDVPVAWHSDTGQFRRLPMHDLYDLITRRQLDSEGNVCLPPDWLEADKVGFDTALKMMTINGAYALKLENFIGSIKAGKFADLIVLSDDPASVNVDSIPNIEILMAMVNGEVQYCREGSEALCP